MDTWKFDKVTATWSCIQTTEIPFDGKDVTISFSQNEVYLTTEITKSYEQGESLVIEGDTLDSVLIDEDEDYAGTVLNGDRKVLNEDSQIFVYAHLFGGTMIPTDFTNFLKNTEFAGTVYAYTVQKTS